MSVDILSCEVCGWTPNDNSAWNEEALMRYGPVCSYECYKQSCELEDLYDYVNRQGVLFQE
jgi:hypothetical protein